MIRCANKSGITSLGSVDLRCWLATFHLATIDSKKMPFLTDLNEGKTGVSSLALKIHTAFYNVTCCIAGVCGVCAASGPVCFAKRFVSKGAAPHSESKVWGIRLEDFAIIVGLFCCAQRAKVPPHRHI